MTSQLNYSLNEVDRIAKKHDTKILKALGFKTQKNGDVKCSCPIHGGNNPQGFSYKSSIKTWQCWTHKCHEKFGPGIVGLVRSYKGYSLQEACEFIYKITQEEVKYLPDHEDEKQSYINEKRKNEEVETLVYPESLLPQEIGDITSFLERGFKQEILNEFKVFHCNTRGKELYGRIVIPLRNEYKEIVGFGGRKTDAISFSPIKWKYQPEGLKVGNLLFGLDKAKEEIIKTKTVIITEGILDFLKFYQNGIINCVSTFSNKISDEQIKLLLSNGVHNLLVGFDNDEGGRIGFRSIQEKYNRLFNIVDISKMFETDPGDTKDEQFSEIKCHIQKYY